MTGFHKGDLSSRSKRASGMPAREEGCSGRNQQAGLRPQFKKLVMATGGVTLQLSQLSFTR